MEFAEFIGRMAGKRRGPGCISTIVPAFSFFALRFSTAPCFGCLLIFVVLGLWSCKQENPDPSKFKVYDGPIMEVDTVQTLYSDSARVMVKMNAPKQLEMPNGDQILPKGVNVVFYKKDGSVSATLRGNHGKLLKEKNIYIVTGNVVVVNEEKKETVNTEELNWSPTTKKITTDKFVTIQTQDELIKGEGLEADQDFGHWRILKPTGTFQNALE
jgi:LPS export ABC transporter protein LptC